jgi:ABC-type branched-subunit amino acid transport system substrate-binding protein
MFSSADGFLPTVTPFGTAGRIVVFAGEVRPDPRIVAMALRRTAVAALVAGLGGAIGMGCPHRGGSPPLETMPLLTTDDPDAEADLRAADRSAEEGRTSEAERLYRAFLDEHPNDPLVPLAELGLGRVLLATGQASEALPHFERAAASSDAVVSERGRMYRGVALHLLDRSAEALELLRPLGGRLVDPGDTALLLRTIAAASLRTGDPIAALDALDALVAAQPSESDVREARERIAAIVADELPADALMRAYDALDRTQTAWPLVALRALRAASDAGDIVRVRAIAADLRARHVELSEELASLVQRAERLATADPRVIGAILPLSGRGREIGQRALRGLMIAAGSPPQGPPAPDAPQLVLRDDGGDRERAARAVEELVSIHRAVAIVGPLDGPAALVAARRAQQFGVPLITLSPADDVTQVGPMVFRLFPSAEGEVRELVRAARARGARRFAAIYPQNAYGQTMRELLERVVASEEAAIATSVSYVPGATSFGRAIETLTSGEPDAVLIPDAARQIALIAPALAAAGLWSSPASSSPPPRGRRIVLLVPSAGFDPVALRPSSRYLQGALFSAPFFADTAQGAARSFADAFLARFATAPDLFAAYAYDAFQLVRRAVESGATSREAVARWLVEAGAMPTAGASEGLGPNREARRATRLLELRGETFVPVP